MAWAARSSAVEACCRRRGECFNCRRVTARRFVCLRPSLGQSGIEEVQPATRLLDGLLHGAWRAQRLGHLEFQFHDARGLGGLASLKRLHLIGGGLQQFLLLGQPLAHRRELLAKDARLLGRFLRRPGGCLGRLQRLLQSLRVGGPGIAPGECGDGLLEPLHLRHRRRFIGPGVGQRFLRDLQEGLRVLDLAELGEPMLGPRGFRVVHRAAHGARRFVDERPREKTGLTGHPVGVHLLERGLRARHGLLRHLADGPGGLDGGFGLGELLPSLLDIAGLAERAPDGLDDRRAGVVLRRQQCCLLVRGSQGFEFRFEPGSRLCLLVEQRLLLANPAGEIRSLRPGSVERFHRGGQR